MYTVLGDPGLGVKTAVLVGSRSPWCVVIYLVGREAGRAFFFGSADVACCVVSGTSAPILARRLYWLAFPAGLKYVTHSPTF